jgi:hypothetical protein
MGRGRAKAKQTKVARELKYSSHGTDLERLQRELAGGTTGAISAGDGVDGTGGTEDDQDDDGWVAPAR